MPQVMLNDLSMNYYDNQNHDKPVLVFIHGLGENLESWTYQIKAFNTNYRVIALDVRGHGLSDDGRLDISMEQMSADVLMLLDYLQINSAHFIGLSMGGMICQELTKNHQDRMLSMVLANTAAFPTNATNYPLDSILNWVKNTPIEKMAEFITKSCLPKGLNQELYASTLNMFKNNRQIPYLSATAATFSIDFRPILADIKVPTLIIVGELDVVTPVWASKYLHEHIQNSRLVIIPKAGHLTKLENPLLFNQSLAEFLQSLD
jgi:pimeloyl-ACP methyl ester carboxylesterase